ncbi:MAG TPA: Smr/MutS family protein [Xanthobacteraceae bacterium]|jgi:DNA-nicking Smr family endonuclease|nr:Smr/MutS family protein [Xanthobacteraceae bacterium]
MIVDDRPWRRRLSEEERELWHGVTRSVMPIKRRRSQAVKSLQAERSGHRNEPASAIPIARVGERKPGAVTTSRIHTPPVKLANPAPPRLMQLDRRTKQRIVRGTDSIDARIDLHGRTQNDAHEALLRFLRRAQADGAKTVLVITGKGSGNAPRERGVLRRQVPLWLSLAEFRAYVHGIEDAHVSHGGEGALYVRVRKAR